MNRHKSALLGLCAAAGLLFLAAMLCAKLNFKIPCICLAILGVLQALALIGLIIDIWRRDKTHKNE